MKKGTWGAIIKQKYLKSRSVTKWCRLEPKNTLRSSKIWMNLVDYFLVIGNWLSWKVVDGKKIKVGLDPWVGGVGIFSLSQYLRLTLNAQGFFTLGDYGDIGSSIGGYRSWLSTTFLGLENHLKNE